MGDTGGADDLVGKVDAQAAVDVQVLEQRRDVAGVQLARVLGHPGRGLQRRHDRDAVDVVVSPGVVASQLPPASAARSTTTEPCRIDATIARVIRIGAGRPGIRAVEITTSDSATCRATSSCSRRWASSESSFA